MTTVNQCPTCAAVVEPIDDGQAPAVPPTGAVLTCGQCNALAVFDGAAWRDPTAEERADLLANDQVVAQMSFTQELSLWRQADAARITACVTPMLVDLLAYRTTVDLAAGDIARVLCEHGFHTHPDQDGAP